jgi:hypothetical protein
MYAIHAFQYKESVTNHFDRSRYETLCAEDCANIYTLITVIINNIHETLNPKGDVIKTECRVCSQDAVQPFVENRSLIILFAFSISFL